MKHSTVLTLCLLALSFSGSIHAQPALVLYDDFNQRRIDPSKWTAVGTGQSIQRNRLLLVNRVQGERTSDQGFTLTEIGLGFPEPGAVTAIATTVRVNRAEVTGCGANPVPAFAMARFVGNFFNTATPVPNDRTNDVLADIGIQRLSSSTDPAGVLRVVARVFHCQNTACSAFEILAAHDLGAANLNEPVRLLLAWEQGNDRFIFQKNREPEVLSPYAVPDTAAPSRTLKGLTAFDLAPNCTTRPRPIAATRALFDDVLINQPEPPPTTTTLPPPTTTTLPPPTTTTLPPPTTTTLPPPTTTTLPPPTTTTLPPPTTTTLPPTTTTTLPPPTTTTLPPPTTTTLPPLPPTTTTTLPPPLGMANVFDPNPVNTLNNTGLRDQNDSNYPELALAYELHPLAGIRQRSDGKFDLIGPFVMMEDRQDFPAGCEPTGAIIGKPPRPSDSPDFIYTRDQDNFEHVMAYFHIDRNQRYIQSLDIFNVNNRQIRVDGHAFAGNDAFYCNVPAGAGFIAFGEGGVDFAEDADVILHEYGHSIQYNQNSTGYSEGDCRVAGPNPRPPPFFDNETQAMGEGFGDYWAFSNNKPGGPFDPPCLGEWKAEGGCGRRLDRAKMYRLADLTGECHDDGELWSATLRDIFVKIGKDATDKIVLMSHFLVPLENDPATPSSTEPTFCDGKDALLKADKQMGGGNKVAIGDVVVGRLIAANLTPRSTFIDDDCRAISPNRVECTTLNYMYRFINDGNCKTPPTKARFASLSASGYDNLEVRDIPALMPDNPNTPEPEPDSYKEEKVSFRCGGVPSLILMGGIDISIPPQYPPAPLNPDKYGEIVELEDNELGQAVFDLNGCIRGGDPGG